jgi:tripartite-type tricarboxylate transporter receptor subunit TctC
MPLHPIEKKDPPLKALEVRRYSNIWKKTMAACLLIAASASPALAQRIVKVVVPYGPGATLDVVARSFTNELSRTLGATVIVENRSGAGGTIGTTAVAKSTDNNTLLLTAASHNLAGHLYKKPGYHPINDFKPVAYIGTAGFILAVPERLKVDSLDAFIKLVKSKPDALNYSSAGNGGATHLGMEALLTRIGGAMQHIPMKGTGDAVNEVVAGRADATIAAVIALTGFAQDHRIRMLAFSGKQRSTLLPNLPTIAESGLPDFSFETWFALLAPSSMPADEIARIHTAMIKVLEDQSVQERLQRQGMELGNKSLDDLSKLLKNDYVAAESLVKASGAKID